MNIGYIGLVAGFMIIVISAPGEYMPGRMCTVGKPLLEAVYLGLLWTIVSIVNVALSVSEDYFCSVNLCLLFSRRGK